MELFGAKKDFEVNNGSIPIKSLDRTHKYDL